MDVLITIFVVLFFAFSNAMLTYFMDFCLGGLTSYEHNSGRIFSRLGAWIRSKYEDWEKKETSELYPDAEPTQDVSDDYLKRIGMHEPKKPKARHARVNWYKAFGMCPVCSNVWYGLFSGALLIAGGFFSLWYFLPYIVISNAVIRRIYKV